MGYEKKIVIARHSPKKCVSLFKAEAMAAIESNNEEDKNKPNKVYPMKLFALLKKTIMKKKHFFKIKSLSLLVMLVKKNRKKLKI